MGLDSVEQFIGFEEAFDIELPDAVASEMITPRRTINYVKSRLARVPADHCLTLQIFYRLRRGIRNESGAGLALRPTTKVHEIAEKREWLGLWTSIREVAGAPGWPDRVPWKGWLVEGPEALRELTVYVATNLPPPRLSRGESWTRERIELATLRVVWDIVRVKGFALDDQYVRDMGVY